GVIPVTTRLEENVIGDPPPSSLRSQSSATLLRLEPKAQIRRTSGPDNRPNFGVALFVTGPGYRAYLVEGTSALGTSWATANSGTPVSPRLPGRVVPRGRCARPPR